MAQQDDHDPAAFLANLAGADSSAPKPASKPEPRPAAPVGRPETPVVTDRDADDHEIDGEIEAELEGEIEDDEDEQIAATPAPRPAASRRMPPKKKAGSLKATAAPILLTVGILLLGPAIWGVAILGGSKTVMGADREDAPMMAKIMQVCWPIAAVLIVSAIVIFVQVAREAKQAKVRR